jgi:hypothetical protein
MHIISGKCLEKFLEIFKCSNIQNKIKKIGFLKGIQKRKKIKKHNAPITEQSWQCR